MKKTLAIVVVSLMSLSSAHANIKMDFDDTSIKFDKLPSEIKSLIIEEYVSLCASDSNDKKTVLGFAENFIRHVDFNDDGLKDYLIESRGAGCLNGGMSIFTGSSDGSLTILINKGDNRYDRELDLWLGREGLELNKYNGHFRYSARADSNSLDYMEWDKELKQFIYFDSKASTKNILKKEAEN